MAHKAPSYRNGSGSVISIAGHPLHPMIVPLPIASLLGVFGADLMYIATQDIFWSRFGFTLIIVGLATGAVAAALGLLEAASLQRARSSGMVWAHAVANVLALITSLGNFKIRWEADSFWVPNAVYLSGAVVALLFIAGWLGGSMSYKHGIGVSERVGSSLPDENPDLTLQGRADVSRER